MPYIIPDQRKYIDTFLKPLLKIINLLRVGDLNYIITKIIKQWMDDYKRPTYDNYNEVIGVLECVKQEFYRRMVVPYEDKKIKENGDVY